MLRYTCVTCIITLVPCQIEIGNMALKIGLGFTFSIVENTNFWSSKWTLWWPFGEQESFIRPKWHGCWILDTWWLETDLFGFLPELFSSHSNVVTKPKWSSMKRHFCYNSLTLKWYSLNHKGGGRLLWTGDTGTESELRWEEYTENEQRRKVKARTKNRGRFKQSLIMYQEQTLLRHIQSFPCQGLTLHWHSILWHLCFFLSTLASKYSANLKSKLKNPSALSFYLPAKIAFKVPPHPSFCLTANTANHFYQSMLIYHVNSWSILETSHLWSTPYL